VNNALSGGGVIFAVPELVELELPQAAMAIAAIDTSTVHLNFTLIHPPSI
jgi:hypothetical protein